MTQLEQIIHHYKEELYNVMITAIIEYGVKQFIENLITSTKVNEVDMMHLMSCYMILTETDLKKGRE